MGFILLSLLEHFSWLFLIFSNVSFLKHEKKYILILVITKGISRTYSQDMFPRNHFFFHSSLNVVYLQFIYSLDSFNIQTHKISYHMNLSGGLYDANSFHSTLVCLFSINWFKKCNLLSLPLWFLTHSSSLLPVSPI